MQEQLTCLLLITASVMLASVVATYAIAISENTVNPDTNSQIGKIQNLQDQLMNQTDRLFNQLPNSYNSTQTSTSP